MNQKSYDAANSLRQRTKKYDTYLPPSISVPKRIVADMAFDTPPEPKTITNPVISHATLNPEVYLSSKPIVQNANTLTKKRLPLNRLFAPIVSATIGIERVTKQSVQAVRYSFSPPATAAHRTKKQKLIFRTLSAVGATSFVMLVGVGLLAALSPHDTKPKIAQHVLGDKNSTNEATNKVGDSASERKPTQEDVLTYLVASLYPRYIRIPDIGVEARVRRLGLDGKNFVGVPSNIFDVGWYDGSAKPGEKDGSSIIAGSVTGQTKQGIFWDLDKLVIGSKFEIEKGNGDLVHYRVTRIEKTTSKDVDMSAYAKPETAGVHDIKLVTGSGKYDKLGGQYSEKLIVFAVSY